MRSSKSRSRSKSNRQRTLGNIINRVFDSSGPEGKVRGTPQQIIDKYLTLARDAQLSNDRVAEQAFFQHAEHYTRMLGEAQREMAREQETRQGQQGNGNGNGNGGQGYQGGDRGDGQRDRHDQRPMLNDDDEQPDFAPLGDARGEFGSDDGPGLVETPEMYHAPRGGDAQEDRGGQDAQPGGQGNDRGPRRNNNNNNRRNNDRGDRGPRPERQPREERAAEAPVAVEQPAVAEERPAATERSAEQQPRGPRGPRKPRQPREPKAAGGGDEGGSAPEAPASSDAE